MTKFDRAGVFFGFAASVFAGTLDSSGVGVYVSLIPLALSWWFLIGDDRKERP